VEAITSALPKSAKRANAMASMRTRIVISTLIAGLAFTAASQLTGPSVHCAQVKKVPMNSARVTSSARMRCIVGTQVPQTGRRIQLSVFLYIVRMTALFSAGVKSPLRHQLV
jgi:hypothetical protein